MNIHPENIIVNSCEYTPVYVIPSPGVTQVGSYYLTSSAQDVQVQKPISDNLKRFYENSGNLESGGPSSPKPRKTKKQASNVVGNNLKLASFLLPKSEPQPQVSTSVPSNVPQKTTNIPQKTANVTQKTTNICHITTNIPQITANITQKTANVTQSTANIPQKTAIIPQKTAIIPQKTASMPQKPAKATQVTKPTINANNKTDVPTSEAHVPQPPLMECDRKIVRVGPIPTKKNRLPPPKPKVPMKLLPKEPLPPPPVTTANTTSVQVIKFGQTYHSLNQLSEDQIQILNKALKMFSSAEAPEQPIEPVYNPDDKPKFIYKLVPAKDLSASDRRMLARKRSDIRKHPVKKVDKKEVNDEATEGLDAEEVPPPKVTRSGRTVKQSRHVRRESPHKPKKKITSSTVQCCQCRNEFPSLYRLQRHYDNFPTHYPERVHSNLFHCLQAILKGCHNNQAFMFVQQVEQLIDKLRTLLPCLLKKMDGVEGSPCTITKQIGRLFGMLPGKYNLNMDALNCVKDTEGHCIHNPAPTNSETAQCSINDDSNAMAAAKDAQDVCARINSVDKWPTVSKRILNKKKIAEENLKAKRIRLASETEGAMELNIDDINHEYEPQREKISTAALAETNQESTLKDNLEYAAESPNTAQVTNSEPIIIHDLTESTSNKQINATNKFYSTHFDIRSSPIKLPSALVKKFQLTPQEFDGEVQILRHCTDQNNLENGEKVQILGVCNEHNSVENINQELQTHDETANICNDVPQNDNSLSQDDSFIDQMFPDNELPKEILYELNQLSFPSNIFDSPLTKALKEVTSFDPSLEKQILFDPSLIDSSSNQSSGKMIEPTLLLKDKVNGYFEPCAIRVKTEKPNGISKSALTHVKERSKILFEVLTDNSEHGITEQSNGYSPKPHNVFIQTNKPISSMFDTNALCPNGLMGSHTNNGIFESGIKHSKDDTLISTSLIDDKSNDMMISTKMNEPSVIEKPSSIIDSNLMDEKSLSDLNDVRLLNNQGHSVLNFLEALGSDCLSYPETDIRNNTEDFQLDLFSFSS